MNERIKELAEQADWSDWTDDDNWIHPAMDRGYFCLSDLEKFAELIVRECASVAREWNTNSEIQGKPDAYILTCFGVER